MTKLRNATITNTTKGTSTMSIHGNIYRIPNANNRYAIVVLYNRLVLRNLNSNTKLLYRHNITRTVTMNRMMITIHMLHQFRCRRGRRTIIFKKQASTPHIRDLYNMFLYKVVAHMFCYRCASLYTTTTKFRLNIRFNSNLRNTTTRRANVIRRALTLKRTK